MKYILILFVIVLTVACNEEEVKTEPVIEEQSEQQVVEEKAPDQSVQIDNMQVNEGIEKAHKHSTVEPESNSKLIEPEVLEKFLPEEVINFQTIPPNYGSSHDGVIFTSVIGEYVGKKGGYFQAAIIDYGYGNDFPDKPFFETLPMEPGYEAKRLESKYGPAYTLWHDVQMDGKLRLYVKNRYYIKIDVTYLSPTIVSMEEILKQFDIESLIKLK